MQTFTDYQQLSTVSRGRAIATIGNLDVVHLSHQPRLEKLGQTCAGQEENAGDGPLAMRKQREEPKEAIFQTHTVPSALHRFY